MAAEAVEALAAATFHLQDGTTRTVEERETTATAVAIDDPFEGALDLLFMPAFDAMTTRAVFFDVVYDEAPNQYHREERLRVEGTDTREVPLPIALFSRALRTYHCRFTFVDSDGSVRRGKFLETNESIISIAEGLVPIAG